MGLRAAWQARRHERSIAIEHQQRTASPLQGSCRQHRVRAQARADGDLCGPSASAATSASGGSRRRRRAAGAQGSRRVDGPSQLSRPRECQHLRDRAGSARSRGEDDDVEVQPSTFRHREKGVRVSDRACGSRWSGAPGTSRARQPSTRRLSGTTGEAATPRVRARFAALTAPMAPHERLLGPNVDSLVGTFFVGGPRDLSSRRHGLIEQLVMRTHWPMKSGPYPAARHPYRASGAPPCTTH
jgi:hypothetical protein